MTLLLAEIRSQILDHRLLVCITCAIWGTWPSLGVCQVALPDENESVANIASRLDSPVFAVRESAMETLSRLDENKLSDLELAFKSLKPEEFEARVRLNSIITRIKSDRTQKQTRSFLRSSDPTQTFGFEGWNAFSKLSGSGRSAKTIFLKMIDDYPELVTVELKSKKESLDKARNIAAAAIQKRMAGGYELADAIALLYCLNVADDLTDRRMESACVSIFRTSPFSQFLVDPQARKSLEPLIAGWSKRVEDRKLDCLILLTERDFPQSKDVAIRLLESKDIDSLEIVRAMQCLYRFGAKSDVHCVEKWLDDRTVFLAQQMPSNTNSSGQEIVTAEHRDVALLVSMHLAGADYSSDFSPFQTHPLWGFRVESLLLPPNSDEVRDSRIKKWKAKLASGIPELSNR